MEMADLIEFFHENPSPSDEEFHAWVEDQGYDPSDVEAMAYRLASEISRFLHEGLAFEVGLTEDDIDKNELAMGIEVEKEHTTNELIAKRIAMDHLAEIDDYYTRLKEMEASAERGKE